MKIKAETHLKWCSKASSLTCLPHTSQTTRTKSSWMGQWPKMCLSLEGSRMTSSSSSTSAAPAPAPATAAVEEEAASEEEDGCLGDSGGEEDVGGSSSRGSRSIGRWWWDVVGWGLGARLLRVDESFGDNVKLLMDESRASCDL